jgi:putative phosphoribosyl transferase
MLAAVSDRVQRIGDATRRRVGRPADHGAIITEVFRDRTEAGERLATEVAAAALGDDVAVLGVPRGGVVVAVPVARSIGGVLDVVVPRKLGAPGNPELGVGAVAPGVTVIDEALVLRLGIAAEYLRGEAARQLEEIERRLRVYREDRPPVSLAGATAAIVDDGVATGVTAVAAVRSARRAGAGRVVFAAPVAPAATAAKLGAEADRVIILETPRSFLAVGEWYERFDQVSDEEVRAALAAFGG